MEKWLYVVKVNLTLVFTLLANMLGGYDTILSLLVSLIVADLVTGTLYAIMTKSLSSTEMRNGIIRKLLIFVVIYTAVCIDNVIIDVTGNFITLWGRECPIRSLFIVYSCIEEGISLVENLSNIGVPIPKWLKGILVQVSECTNKSTPKDIINLIKKVFGVVIPEDKPAEEDGKATIEDKDEKQ